MAWCALSATDSCGGGLLQGLSVAEYERKKEEVADGLVARLERHLPGLDSATLFREACAPLFRES